MKNVVSLHDLLEGEVRPAALLAEYLALTEREVRHRWGAPNDTLVTVACQACGDDSRAEAFHKFGFRYDLCGACGTLYASARPTQGALQAYYRDAESVRFWRERVLPETAEARATKIAGPRAQWVADGIAEHRADAVTAVDLSPAGSTLGQELLGARPGERAKASYGLGELGLDGAPRVVVRHDVTPGAVDIVTAFDVVDRAADLPALLGAIWTMLKPGGLLFATATSVSGFDLQVLWERSATLTPPDKLQALSVTGFQRLFAAPHWELIELSTPGMLDVENVRRAVSAEPNGAWPRVVKNLCANLDDHGWASLQEFLQEHRLASFVRLIARRRA
ncbi:MAG: hypothetical protein AMXMBFR57_16660 [Acidimicrobiia bacterium]